MISTTSDNQPNLTQLTGVLLASHQLVAEDRKELASRQLSDETCESGAENGVRQFHDFNLLILLALSLPTAP